MSNNEIVRVLRILEYTGPRGAVEKQVRQSIHGEKKCLVNVSPGASHWVMIRAATIGEFPEVLMRDEPVDEPVAPTNAKPIPVNSEFAPSPIVTSIPPFSELICNFAGCAHPYATHSEEGCMVWNGNGNRYCKCKLSFGVYDINVAESFSVGGAPSWNSAPASTPDDEVPF